MNKELSQQLIDTANEKGEQYISKMRREFADQESYADGYIDGFVSPKEADSKWISVDVETPLAYMTGAWDGKQSDQVLGADKNGNKHLVTVYEGFMDGNKFLNWFDDNDFEIDDIVKWMKIPD